MESSAAAEGRAAQLQSHGRALAMYYWLRGYQLERENKVGERAGLPYHRCVLPY